MVLRFVLVGTASVALCGCSAIPLSHPQDIPDLVHHVQCELKETRDALQPDYPWLKTWAASFTLTMKAEVIAGASPSASLLGPFGVGSYIFPFGGAITSDGIRTGSSKYTVRFDHLDLIDCNTPQEARFQGSLGIKDWFANVVVTQGAKYREPDTVGHTQMFIITVSGNVNPSYTLVRSRANAAFSLGRIDTDIIDIAMTNAPKPKPQEVIIVNPPGHAGRAPLAPFFLPGVQRTSPLRQKGRLTSENPNSEISNDARARLDNQLQELQLRNLFNR